MNSNWKVLPLGELATVGAGNSAPQDKTLFADGTIPFFRTSDIGRIRFGDINTTADLLNEQGARGLRRLQAGTILFPKSGASTFLNHRVMIQVEGCVSSHLATITAKPDFAEPRFLLYFLATVQAQDMVQDHAYPSLNLPLISGIRVPTPTLAEQRRIIAILDEAFESIAAAKVNAEKNLQNARELFESALNSIEGSKEQLGEYVTIKTGKLDANAAVTDGEYPFFTCSREIFAIDTFAFDCEAILLAGNNAVGDFNVKHYSGKFNAYQRTYVITIQSKNRLRYRYLYFQLLKSLKKFKEQSVGSSTKFLKLGMIKELEITLPPVQEQDRQLKLLSTLLEKVEDLENIYSQKVTALDELKKSLLHQAFSGQL